MSAKIVCGDSSKSEVWESIPDGVIDLVVTSPPYVEQRNGVTGYAGIPEKEYPDWMVQIFENIRPKLRPETGNILINIRPHLRDGVIVDYVLRMRLRLREAGFFENEELIWYKPDAPP